VQPLPDTAVADEIHDLIIDVLRHRIGKDERAAKSHDWFQAAILALRDKIIDAWMDPRGAPMIRAASGSIISAWSS
jgi:starch phosphorylase